MKTKSIPVTIALLAGLITCIMAILNGMGMEEFVKILLLVIVGFYILGSIIRLLMDKNFKTLEEEGDPEQSGQEILTEESSPESGMEEGNPQKSDTSYAGAKEDE